MKTKFQDGIKVQGLGLPVSWDTVCRPTYTCGVDVEPSLQASGKRHLPTQNWQTLCAEDIETLSTTEVCPFHSSVSVFSFDEAIAKRYRGKKVQELLFGDSSAPEDRKSVLWNLADRLLGSLRKSGIKESLRRSCDVQITPPGSRSTAYDYKNNEFIGLHIDNHDKLKLQSRTDAFTLICANIGEGDRCLSFVNQEVAAVLSKVQLSAETFDSIHREASWKLLTQFFEQFPDYPIVKLRIPPNHGYIAVTQNFIHDGANDSETLTDHALLVAGSFLTGQGC